MPIVVEPEPPSVEKTDHGGSSGDGGDNGGRRYGGGGGGDRDQPSNPSSGHAVLGMLIFIISEFVFFAALAVIFVLARGNHVVWPPPDQPRLPALVTGINTIILLASGYTMYLARKNIRRDHLRALKRWLFVTGGLGVMFLSIQGVEWLRLLNFGFIASGNLYAATFYVIIGAHALHVFIAVLGILFVWARAMTHAYSAAHHTGVILCQMFWLFVVFIWPLLYAVVYMI